MIDVEKSREKSRKWTYAWYHARKRAKNLMRMMALSEFCLHSKPVA
jgi:hypothetical protein